MQEKIVYELKSLFDNVASTVTSNLIKEVTTGKIKIPHDQLTVLVNLINSSVNQSFSQSNSFFIKNVINLLEDKETKKQTSLKKK